MRLKRVRIFGFKTFADVTDIHLDGDLIAVVGPNGCGKSNLVDAILWALGEPNARNLRAQNSHDVIFSGSSKRKPIGFAEVTLIFDNESGSLPIDAAEVAVTRRLTRSGDSEFSINRRSCRMRDVYDLFADSGLGRAGYAIVGQKEIDSALVASAEERRAWVDEAAGVQRYRARRLDSLRRLETATDHLSRVEDLLREIEAQRAPLAAEAEVAKRYREIQGSLHELESGLLVHEVASSTRDLAEAELKVTEAHHKAQEEADRAEKSESHAAELGREIALLESEADSVRALHQSTITTAERAQAKLDLIAQKLSGLTELEGSLLEENEGALDQLELLKTDVDALQVEVNEAQAALDKIIAQSEGSSEQQRKLQAALTEAERTLTQARDAEAEARKAKTHYDQQEMARSSCRRELDGIRKTLPELERALADAEEACAALGLRRQDLEAEQQATQAELDARVAELDALLDCSRAALTAQSALAGRSEGIAATLRAHEGLGRGPASLLEAVQEGTLSDDFVALGEVIQVDAEHITAIEAALGSASQDLVVTSIDSAHSGLAYVRKVESGRVTFRVLDLQRPIGVLSNAGLPKGSVGIASKMARTEPRWQQAIDALLGDVLIVESLGERPEAWLATPWRLVVSLAGDVVSREGTITAGVPSDDRAGIVERKSQLAQLQMQSEVLTRELDAWSKEEAVLRTKCDESRRNLQQTLDSLVQLGAEWKDAMSWLSDVRAEHIATTKSMASLELKLAEPIAPPPNSVTADFEALEAARDAAMHGLAAFHAQGEQVDVRIAECRSRLGLAQSRKEEAQRRLNEGQRTDAKRSSRISEIQPQRQRLEAEKRSANAELSQAEVDRKEASRRLDAVIARRCEKLEASFRFAEEAKSARRQCQSWTECAHAAELQRARLDAKRASSAQRLMEEYGISADDALATAHTVTVPADAPALVSRLRREMRALGEVNVGAIEAYDRLTKRHDELAAQQADLMDSKESILRGIAELDVLTRERFMSTFQKLEISFAQVFQELFGGGEGVLKLTNPHSVLDTGVEIDVTIPGKKRQRLELLSGGERALSACAFLFALLRVKPSPLVVLDEVDAPLDGRNVERFVSALRGQTARTQFVLITHNQVTIESAPIWFGVTMPEPGVSMVVPYRTNVAKVQGGRATAVVTG